MLSFLVNKTFLIWARDEEHCLQLVKDIFCTEWDILKVEFKDDRRKTDRRKGLEWD